MLASIFVFILTFYMNTEHETELENTKTEM